MPSFCNKTEASIDCSPSKDSDIGKHNVEIFLSDGSMTNSYSLLINVVPGDPLPYIDPTLADRVKTEGINKDITFRIEEISSSGEVTIKFSEELIVPNNWRNIT